MGAQPADGREITAGADIAGYPVHPVGGEIQPSTFGILQNKILALRAIRGDPGHPRKPGDAMIDMNHVVAKG
ncbi:MAG: hypothetical protein DDT27_01367 [Dehalococcoidia bacterium]|nr:hypothetical protein [Chloroflexota bacterium]